MLRIRGGRTWELEPLSKYWLNVQWGRDEEVQQGQPVEKGLEVSLLEVLVGD